MMGTRILVLILVIALGTLANAQEEDEKPLIFFPVTGAKAAQSRLGEINSAIVTVLSGEKEIKLIGLEELSDDLLSPPTDELMFCRNDPVCIAKLVLPSGAIWVLYGDSETADNGRIQIHLVLLDVIQKKVAREKRAEFSESSDLPMEAGELVRGCLSALAPETAGIQELDLENAPLIKLETPEDLESPLKEEAQDTAAKKPVVETKVEQPAGPSPWTNPWMLTSASVGVVALTTGLILGQFSVAREQDAEDCPDQPRAIDLLGEAQDFATGANIAYVVGGLSLGTAVVFLVLDLVDEDSPTVVPQVACTAAGCLGSATVRF